VARRDVWLILNNKNEITRLITFISELSFPLFLIHSPLRFIITFLVNHGTGKILAVTVFLVISILFSWALLDLDERMHRQKMLAGFQRT
jgi:peptidoglycan/LPS O-acetylase OafA/YrhL